MSLVPKCVMVSSKEELKTENRQLKIVFPHFIVVGVLKTEIFMSFNKLPFYKQTS